MVLILLLNSLLSHNDLNSSCTCCLTSFWWIWRKMANPSCKTIKRNKYTRGTEKMHFANIWFPIEAPTQKIKISANSSDPTPRITTNVKLSISIKITENIVSEIMHNMHKQNDKISQHILVYLIWNYFEI